MTEAQKRFTCDWIYRMLVVNCDGKVVCGCADPYGERPLGNAHETPLYEIWNSEKVRKIRAELNEGYSPFCEPCGLKQAVDEQFEIPQRPLAFETLPRIFLENSVGCNISCFKSVCNDASGIIRTRDKRLMSWDEFKHIIDQVAENLTRIDFFNYGEPFMHPRAVDMIEYIKEINPLIYLYVSTNGLLLTWEKIKRLVDAKIDEITFSVDGPDQEAYVKYRIRGDFDRVFRIMKMFVEERNRAGHGFPVINWRYILFRWNDSSAQMNRARKLARKIGVDRLVWEITDHPGEAKSEKYQIGTPAWKAIYNEIWDTSHFANAIPDPRFNAGIKVLTGKLHARAGQSFKVPVKIKNKGTSYWHRTYHGWLRSIRLGAQLHDARGHVIDRDFARAFIPDDMGKGRKAVMDIEIPGIEKPGTYKLKLDMVMEGIDWFENNGSKVTWRTITVA